MEVVCGRAFLKYLKINRVASLLNGPLSFIALQFRFITSQLE